MEKLPAMAPDYHVIRTYLDFILELPWKNRQDLLDLNEAQKVLDEDHYDIKDVKERILEFLAVLNCGPTPRADSLFRGAPGVGKTSLGRSIARAMGRKFERLSLGGVRDEAELRGHRRTYVGAMPGRIIQSIRGRREQPGDDARRDRQARRGLSRRSGSGAARDSRS
jgi:ATP-dependent Lon protease